MGDLFRQVRRPLPGTAYLFNRATDPRRDSSIDIVLGLKSCQTRV